MPIKPTNVWEMNIVKNITTVPAAGKELERLKNLRDIHSKLASPKQKAALTIKINFLERHLAELHQPQTQLK